MAQSQTTRRFDPDLLRAGAIASAVSVMSLIHYSQGGQILMHGDTTAHINIARRVFDSLTPGPLQLGTVWLPLPHLLMIPFIWPDAMWQNGAGGAIPSMIAYVLGVAGIFRLVRGALEADVRTRAAAPIGSWVTAFVYGANPNLIYMQATALTETLYLAFFIWATVYFAEFLRASAETGESGEAPYALTQCAYCLACAELTRYDGWFLAAVMGAIVAAIALRRWRDFALWRSTLKFLLGIAVAPTLWLAYNALVYGSALAFANGPYSAKAIEQRVGAPIPGFHNLWVAGLYFLKSAQITLAAGNWGRFWLAGAVAATVIAVRGLRRGTMAAILLLLWSPLAFYALMIAYGSVPLHVPMWWPFAIFNQRFGLELLPLFAIAAGVLVAAGYAKEKPRHARALVAAALALIVTSYAFVWKAAPLCWQEAAKNWEIRRSMDTAVENAIVGLPPDSRFLMDIGEHVGIMERLGIPLRHVVNPENHRPWKRPADPEGIWERALANPGRYADYVITFQGDLADRGVNKTNLTLLTEIHAMGRPPARIYATRRSLNQSYGAPSGTDFGPLGWNRVNHFSSRQSESNERR